MYTNLVQRRFSFGCAWVGILAVLMISLGVQCPPAPVQRASSVQGFLVADTASLGSPDTTVFIPRAKVWLRDVETGTESQRVRSDLSGRFYFPPQLPGTYEMCWEASGFATDCRDETVSIVSEAQRLGNIKLGIPKPTLAVITVPIVGHVRFADGSLPRRLEPFFNVNAFATVVAIDDDGVALTESVVVNNFGDFILPQVPFRATGVRTTIEGLAAETPLTISDPTLVELDIVLPNHRPRIQGLVGSASGDRQWSAAPGDRVRVSVSASDEDGDELGYQWFLFDSSTVLHEDAGASVEVSLPNLLGVFDFNVLVYDGRGGYATDTVRITTSGVRFSGRVSATDSPAVEGATVLVNDHQTTTRTDGSFELTVPENARYVLNIRKKGNGLVSKIYDTGITGGRWVMRRAQVTAADPRNDIDIQHDRTPSDCPGPLGTRVNWTEFRRFRQPAFQDGKGGAGVQPAGAFVLPHDLDQRECGPGIRIQIPANSLVDADGNLPPEGTLLEIALSTVDPTAPDSMPGDFTAISEDGETRVMDSYGAGSIDITAGDREYQLAPGAVATVRIPIDPYQLAGSAPIPNEIPILFYNESTGDWLQEPGVVAIREGDEYRAEITHLSEINADTLKVNQACVRIVSVVMPPVFDLEASFESDGATKVVSQTVDNSLRRVHTLYNLPTDTEITFQVYEEGSASPLPLLLPPVVNSGGPQEPTDPNRPEFPYAACQASVDLIAEQVPDNVANEFLHGFGLAPNLDEGDPTSPSTPDEILASVDKYYEAIDPFSRRRDLEDFRSTNNFDGTDEIAATYANSADLGFGREMHCKTSGSNVACYVVNYGDHNSDDTEDFALALARINPIAAVAMEYSPIEDPAGDGSTFLTDASGEDKRIVKFYVFKQALDDPETEAVGFGRAPSANLDGLGERAIPQLCMVCHGGELPNITTSDDGSDAAPAFDPDDPLGTVDLKATFIPFDLAGFTLPMIDGVDYKATQQDEFKSLNQTIVCASEPTSAISDIINQMYGGSESAACGTGSAGTQAEDFAVDGWSTDEAFYRSVVATSCRTCHASQVAPSIYWDDIDEFTARAAGVDYYVCDQHVMPHALITYKRFWLSVDPHQPQELHDFLQSIDSGFGEKCLGIGAP